MLNRIVLVGNGFDLAHGLKTSYGSFIEWYIDQRLEGFKNEFSSESMDPLFSIKIEGNSLFKSFNHFWGNKSTFPQYANLQGVELLNRIAESSKDFSTYFTPLFGRIYKQYGSKGWVDIENEYYTCLKNIIYGLYGNLSFYDSGNNSEITALNESLEYLKKKVIEYLSYQKRSVENSSGYFGIIYGPFRYMDISIGNRNMLHDHIRSILEMDSSDLDREYRLRDYTGCTEQDVNYFKSKYPNPTSEDLEKFREDLVYPSRILILNFNYTPIADGYINKHFADINHIHGILSRPESVVFGYGDELDSEYPKIQALNDNECLKYFKSIKYLESDSYRKLLRFIESAPYQIVILGHSCGNSDRTLLNTLFEHKNCISIKPYYYLREGFDNYLDIVQNISRNFTNMQLMRDTVVNKSYCEDMPQLKYCVKKH